MMDNLVFAFWSPGPGEMLLLAIVALLLYGGNLPEVARSWGKTFAEFRRGLSGIQNEINDVIYHEPNQIEYRDDAYFANGYEESDPYLDEPEDSYSSGETSGADTDDQNNTDAQDDSDDDKTVKDVSADTVAIDPPKSKPSE